MAESATTLLKSGPDGLKTTIVVLGDGFTAAEQGQYNDYVDKQILAEVFGRDFFSESKQAFNLVRINLDSAESGVSQHRYDDDGNITSRDDRDTALDNVFTGRWDRCWMEEGPDTVRKINGAIGRLVTEADYILVVLNEAGFGGCARGNRLYVTTGVDWDVIAHEFGHGLGGLADEYCRKGSWDSRSEPPNLTTNSDRASLKWRKFVEPSTPVPTGINPEPGNGKCTMYNQGLRPEGWDPSTDAGLFEGGGTKDSGVYRPVESCRMRSNRPDFCPICYTHLKERYRAASGQTFERVYTGDFNGDGRDEVLVHNGNAMQLYTAAGSQLELAFNAVERLPGSWQLNNNDRFIIGDFNGDGKDEIVVYNGSDWNKAYLGVLASDNASGLRLVRRYETGLTGWSFGRHDRFHVADLNGDGKDDLIVINTKDWSTPYLALLRSSGNGFTVSHRYDATVDGWQMRTNDEVLVGDFDGDGKDGVCMVNTKDWNTKYLGLMSSDGTKLEHQKRYDDTIPGWQMGAGDKYYVGDFDGDGVDDMYVFNGADWNTAYLGMLRSSGDALASVRRYDGNAPGWQMRKNDRHMVADIDGNGRADLFVYNHDDWSSEYLGTMASTGNALTCRASSDRIGEWNLGASDAFEVCNYEGTRGRRDLVVHNKDWLGLLRATPALSLQRIYKHWIHNYSYGRNW